MSGICGVVALDGTSVRQTDLERMLAKLERRGPDGTHCWIDGERALGHTSLATTPEALNEQLPFTHRSSGCTITADVRLDNRADLLAALGIASPSPRIGDGELILRSYLKWGNACLDHLLGDFAFAIWDARERTLLCARDLTGMRQLNYYHGAGKLFAFATEPQAVLQHTKVPHQINEGRIGDFLEGLEAYDLTSTFYTGIHRLAPGHAMLLRDGKLRLWRYAQLSPQPILKLSGDEAYVEAFREVFTEAVQSRLRSPHPVGSMLSGGMDSGSVSAVAAQLLLQSGGEPLDTFSAVGTDPDCPETRAIEAALSINHIRPNRVSLGDIDAYRADLEKVARESAEPFDTHMTLLMAVYLAAQRLGHKVVLDGVGGDTTLGTQNMITWNLHRGRIIQAWREARGEERFWEHPQPALQSFIRSSGQVLIPQRLRSIRQAYLRNRAKRFSKHTSLLSANFAKRIDIESRIRASNAHVAYPTGDGPTDRQKRVLHPYVIVARERYDRVASSLAIEPRDPFLDRRVLEFCLSLPADQLQRNGWPKFILRQSTKGMLLDEVRWRAGKEHLGWDFTKAIWREYSPEFEDTLVSLVSSYVSEDALGDVKSFPSDETAFATGEAIRYLSDWISTKK